MKFEKYRYENVEPDGILTKRFKYRAIQREEQGEVLTKGGIFCGVGKGCGLSGCHCSDGYSISITLPRTEEGIVEGILVKFDSREEMLNVLKDIRGM
jgi:hypothetical protein